MLPKARIVLLAFLLTVYFVRANGAQAAQNQTQNTASGAVRGQVIIPSVHASERIEVTLRRPDGPIVQRTYSDTLGNYEFRGLAAGNYDVVVQLEGYEDVKVGAGVGAGAQFGTNVVNIMLNEKKEIRPVTTSTDESDFVDVSELKQKFPKKAYEEYDKAREDYRNGNLAKAIGRLEAVVKIAPDFYSPHNTLGTIYQEIQRYRDAETEYRAARRLNPLSVLPLTSLGSLYIQEATTTGKNDADATARILRRALDVLEEAVRMNSRSATAYYFLGAANYQATSYAEAEHSLKRALDLDTAMGRARLTLVNVHLKQQNWQGALLEIDTYLKDNPSAVNRTELQETRAKVVKQIQK